MNDAHSTFTHGATLGNPKGEGVGQAKIALRKPSSFKQQDGKRVEHKVYQESRLGGDRNQVQKLHMGLGKGVVSRMFGNRKDLKERGVRRCDTKAVSIYQVRVTTSQRLGDNS